MQNRLDSVDDVKSLLYEFYKQPTSHPDLFEKARVFSRFRVNVGLDYVLLDDFKVECSEMFTDLLLRDLEVFAQLDKNSDDYKVIRSFVLSILKSRKTGVIWRFVSPEACIRCEFLLFLDFRRCPVAKRYISALACVFLEATSQNAWRQWFDTRDILEPALVPLSFGPSKLKVKKV